jgi:hypothetical protein
LVDFLLVAVATWFLTTRPSAPPQIVLPPQPQAETTTRSLRFSVESPRPIVRLEVLLTDRVLWQESVPAGSSEIKGEFALPPEAAEIVWVADFTAAEADQPGALCLRYRLADGPRQTEMFWGRGDRLEAVMIVPGVQP